MDKNKVLSVLRDKIPNHFLGGYSYLNPIPYLKLAMTGPIAVHCGSC